MLAQLAYLPPIRLTGAPRFSLTCQSLRTLWKTRSRQSLPRRAASPAVLRLPPFDITPPTRA
ncbi:hypothetical protein BZL30_4888 [Mycobacterium kansasii]|uniref:Uncharacterized protein n=1 Tax=Mycobacterium kansasii TaxID=1768 RepID=A0A1V3X2I6_MYCKA|nr:hypothetical protein BZL30_4888 [Mycobacterium kansasii]